MKYASVCSGIEAATVAWHSLGWKPAWFSEIEKFPSAVLNHHYPTVPNLGDMTKIEGEDIEPGRFDLLVGGTPCQSFSVAGLRKGMDDPRGNLALHFLKLIDTARPQWVVWENVPGVLSSNEGRDFGAFLGGLAECGYGWAYRILNAQYFGVPQRRRRVFVVGHLGDWRRSAAVLFERQSMCGDTAPSSCQGEEAAGTTAKCLTARGAGGGTLDPENANFIPYVSDIAATVDASDGAKWGCNQWVDQGKAVVAFQSKASASQSMNPSAITPTLDKCKGDGIAICFNPDQSEKARSMGEGVEVSPTLRALAKPVAISKGSVVRRLTPRECERLQGFPDDYTAIPWRSKAADQCPDGPRYKALGNSMAVPVMRWIGERIKMIDVALEEVK